MFEAYRKFLWHSATIRRNTTAKTSTGTSHFVYADLYTNVPCNVQDGGGRMKQDEQGQTTGKKLSIVFASEWAGQLQHNDLVVVNGATFRITHAHQSWYIGPHHVEIGVEVYVPAGDVGDQG